MLPHAILICISLITSEIEGFTGLSILLWIASLSPFPLSYWIISLHFELRHSLSFLLGCPRALIPGGRSPETRW